MGYLIEGLHNGDSGILRFMLGSRHFGKLPNESGGARIIIQLSLSLSLSRSWSLYLLPCILAVRSDASRFQSSRLHMSTDPDPWEDLESRSPLRAPRNYPIVV